jgi:putative DNA methylase
MRIEVGGPPRYQGLDLIRARGWTHWHHLFNPQQLLVGALVNKHLAACLTFSLTQVLNLNSRLSRFDNSEGGAVATKGAFDNQSLNTLFNYSTRGIDFLRSALEQKYPSFPIGMNHTIEVHSHAADNLARENDLFITDPPYDDAIKYEEILDFFIAWLWKNPPPEFADWVWDSRRSLAIKGENEDFRRSMVAAYKRMTECIPDNGMQVIMFTHQDGPIWEDMANIVWASGLQVTAAWYVATETDSALRAGSHVKGTVLLACRKRQGSLKTTRDDLAWELQEEVEAQVQALTGLNQEARGLYRDEHVFEDADLQMTSYAAAQPRSRTGRLPRQETRNLSPRGSQCRPHPARTGEEPAPGLSGLCTL